MSWQEQILVLLTCAALAPLASCLVLLLVGKRWLGRGAGWLATGMMVLSFLACGWVVFLWLVRPEPGTILWKIPWIPLPSSPGQWLYLGMMVDSLTVAMMALVSGISLLVHLYSIGYMAGDSRYERFFAYLSLFTFAMMGIVLSHSLLMILIFWELVGLTSYLLIGFWFERRGPMLACTKAFVMNRIGDMGFLIGFGILFYQLGGRVFLPAVEGVNGTISMLGALTRPAPEGLGLDLAHPPMWLTWAGVALFFGAIGKSAQFPLHTWLPDAMEGPTPVSSIVHSATMVAAGVYLAARLQPILTPAAHLFVASVGLVTLVLGASMALVMTDIKRVLAYSTISQLGYMMLGVGTGAWSFALYHLMVHAFFKCSLFQCAGSVMHAAHHQQDMRYFGGLWRKMPITAGVYLVCLLVLGGASLPLTGLGLSGFYSKDGILAGAVHYGRALSEAGYWFGPLFYVVPMVVAYLTVLYMGRSFALTFLGRPRDEKIFAHAHEAPWTMLLPQTILAVLALLAAPGILPVLELINASSPANVLPGMIAHEPGQAMYEGFEAVHAGLGYGLGWVAALTVALVLYVPGFRYAERIAELPGVRWVYQWVVNKFYFDALYDQVISGLVRAVAGVAAAFDRHVVDGLVNLAGYLGRGLAAVAGWMDAWLVDGFYELTAATVQDAGEVLRTTHTGRVRAYLLALFAGLVAACLLVLVNLSR